MKTLCLITLAFISALAGCTEAKRNQGNTIGPPADQTSAVISTDTLCFERYSGLRNQDTASVRIVIAGSEVYGDYSNFPYQKDARIGRIYGKKSGNEIKGIWRYKQEGMTDSIPFDFKLEGDELLQRKTTFSVSTGRETLSDTSAFSVLFEKIDCKDADYRMKGH